MLQDMATAKALAAKLVRILESEMNTSKISHSEGLELVARLEGDSSWQALRAKLIRSWCYNRHAPYLPNSPEVVKALSVRKAVFDETASAPQDSEQAFFAIRKSLSVTIAQIESAHTGALRVEPELTAALRASRLYTSDDLRATVESTKTAFKAFEAVHCVRPLCGVNVERYQQRYTAWRLAELSLAYHNHLRAAASHRFQALLDDQVDVYGYVALFIEKRLSLDQEIPLGDVLYNLTSRLRRDDSNARYFAKSAFLEYLTSGTPEYAKLNIQLDLPQWDSRDVFEAFAQIEQLFPELALWHAWVELKPLFASGIDKVLN